LKSFDTNIDYLNRIAGTNLKIETMTKLLTRMGLETTNKDEQNLTVKVPVTRSDVIHA
jgi:phenylalanyl-tRNA synthetase beta subunit